MVEFKIRVNQPAVPMKMGNAIGWKELHNNNISEETSAVLRDRRNDGNKTRKNSRNI